MVTANLPADGAGPASSPPSIPTRSSSTATSRRRPSPPSAGPVWKALRVGAERPRGRRDRAEPARSWTPARSGILLDAAGGPHPGGTGTPRRHGRSPPPSRARCRSPWRVASARRTSAEARARRPRGRRGRGVGHGAPAEPRRAAAQGPGRRRPVRQACPRRPPPPAQRRLRPHAGPPRPARGRRLRPLGQGARLRRAVRPRDAGRRAGAARVRLRRDPPRPPVLGGAGRPAGPVRRAADVAVPGGPPGRRRRR